MTEVTEGVVGVEEPAKVPDLTAGEAGMAKGRAKRVWTDEQKLAMSKRVRRYWKARKAGKVVVKAKAPHKAKAAVAKTNGVGAVAQAPRPVMKARLTAYGVNPNTGVVELYSQDLGESMVDLLPNMIALLYNGIPMTEIRVEQR